MTELDTIVCSDALAFARTLPDNSVDMELTSPPYDDLRKYNGYSWDFEALAHELYRVLKPGGMCVWVVGDATINGSETLTSMRQALYFVDEVGFKMHDTMIWDKRSSFEPANVRYYQVAEFMFILAKTQPIIFNPIVKQNSKFGQKLNSSSRKRNGQTIKLHGNGKLYRRESPLNNIWQLEPGYMKSSRDVISFDHPATFPEELARRHIYTWSNPGDLVFDPFMGSGTTAKMARKLGRHYIGCDISPEYVAIAQKRLRDSDPYQPSEVADGVTQLSLFGE